MASFSQIQDPLKDTHFEYDDTGFRVSEAEISREDPLQFRKWCTRHWLDDGSIRRFVDTLGVAWTTQRSYQGNELILSIHAERSQDAKCALPPLDVLDTPLDQALENITLRCNGSLTVDDRCR